MKNLYLICFTLIFVHILKAQQSEDYNWQSVPIGGGGYISGMQIHPQNSNVRYFRTDIGGAYKWDNVNQRLKPIIFSTESEHYSVAGIALHPTNQNIVYLAVGRTCNNTKSAIYKSSDAGETFEVVTNLPFHFAGNGSRNCSGNFDDKDREGTPLAVNPLNPDELFIGTRGDGLYKMNLNTNMFVPFASNTILPNTDERIISTIKFHPTDQNIMFLTYVGEGVFRGNVSNEMFTKLTFNATINAALENAIDLSISKNADYMLVACKNSGILKATNILGTANWSITPTLYENVNKGYLTVECSPHNNNVAIICAAKWDNISNIETSNNAGNSWMDNNHTFDLNNNVFPWKTNSFGSNIGQFAFDPFNANVVHFSSFMSTFTCDNFSANASCSWNTLNAKGHEEIVTTDLCAIPLNTANNFLVAGSADHAGFVFDDITQDNYATGDVRTYLTVSNPNNLKKTQSIDFCENQPDHIVVSLTKEWDNSFGGIAKTNDGGLNWDLMNGYNINDEKSIVAVSSTNPNNVIFLNKNGLKYTLNNGNTILNSSGTTTDFNDLNESVFSAMRTICADKVNGSIFYYYDWNGDFYQSADGGITWQLQSNTLPTLNDEWQKARLIAIPNKANHLWFNLNEKLFRSTNGGQTWTEITNIAKVIALGNGIGENIDDYDALYFYGKLPGDVNNYFYRSTDEAQTWISINNHAEKELWNDTKLIAGDRQVFGRVYISASGQGVWYGDAEINNCSNFDVTVDGTFDANNSPTIPNWNLHTSNGAVANGSINSWDNAIIDIANAGTFVWDVQLWQDNLAIEAGKFYLLKTRLESDADRTIVYKIRNRTNGSLTYIEDTLQITTFKQDYSILFEAPVTDNDVRLTFLFGGNTNNLNIDKIVLTEYCQQPTIDETYCDEYVYLKNHNIAPSYFKAATQLKCDGNVNGNGFTSFKAGTEILLQPGFEINANNQFQALIEGCD